MQAASSSHSFSLYFTARRASPSSYFAANRLGNVAPTRSQEKLHSSRLCERADRWARVRRKGAQGATTRTAPPRGGIQPVAAMVDVDPRASERANQPGNERANEQTDEPSPTNPADSPSDRDPLRSAGEPEAATGILAPLESPGGFDGGDTRCVVRKNHTDRRAGRREENGGRDEPEVAAVEGESEREKEGLEGVEERSWWAERDGTRGSSHHVVYQRHFILIFQEGGAMAE